MKIETKFEVGQKVFILIGTKLIEKEIHSIKAEIEKDDKITINIFFFDENGNCILKNESEVFATKDEFFKQLDIEQ